MTDTQVADLYQQADVNYHHAHRPYLNAVADALTSTGFNVLFWDADPNDPRDGAIQIEPVGRLAGHDEVWIGWQEERGWTLVTVDDQPGDDRRYVYDLPAGNLFSPSSVARTVAEFCGQPWSGVDDDHPDVEFRDRDVDDEDPGFERALLRYSTPADGTPAAERG